MSTLRMDTDAVLESAARSMSELTSISEQVDRIRAAIAYLDWTAPAAYNFSQEINECIIDIQTLVNNAEQLLVRVNKEASAWESMGASPFPLATNFSFLSLLVGGRTLPSASIVVTRLMPAIGLLSVFQGWILRLPLWMKEKISHLLPSTQPTSTASNQTGYIPKAWLQSIESDDLVSIEATPAAQTQNENSYLPKQVDNQPTPETFPSTIEPNDIVHNVPVKSQVGLKYNGTTTAYGCVPTSTSMITDYWHQQNEANPTISSQDLLNQNTHQKSINGNDQFGSRGMSIDNVADDLTPLGYQVNTITGTAENSAEQLNALRTAVNDGPVLAVVRVGLANQGYSHAVVVTGITTDGHVIYNDPLIDSAQKVTLAEFDRSWGSNFGSKYPTRMYATIQPPN